MRFFRPEHAQDAGACCLDRWPYLHAAEPLELLERTLLDPEPAHNDEHGFSFVRYQRLSRRVELLMYPSVPGAAWNLGALLLSDPAGRDSRLFAGMTNQRVADDDESRDRGTCSAPCWQESDWPRYVSIFRRLFRRLPRHGGCCRTLIELLSRYSVPAAAASDETFRELDNDREWLPRGHAWWPRLRWKRQVSATRSCRELTGQGAASQRSAAVGRRACDWSTELGPCPEPWASLIGAPRCGRMPGSVGRTDLGPDRGQFAWQPLGCYRRESALEVGATG